MMVVRGLTHTTMVSALPVNNYKFYKYIQKFFYKLANYLIFY